MTLTELKKLFQIIHKEEELGIDGDGENLNIADAILSGLGLDLKAKYLERARRLHERGKARIRAYLAKCAVCPVVRQIKEFLNKRDNPAWALWGYVDIFYRGVVLNVELALSQPVLKTVTLASHVLYYKHLMDSFYANELKSASYEWLLARSINVNIGDIQPLLDRIGRYFSGRNFMCSAAVNLDLANKITRVCTT